MQKALLAAAAFVIGATVGMGLLAATIVVGLVLMRHSGPSLYARGIGHWTVLAVPVICGGAAAWWAVRRVSRNG
jgi:UPF0716 family protein affecting phage T7 exclusion